MEENTKVSPKKASRNLPSHYSSSLLYEVSSAEKLNGIKLAMCNPGQAENERHDQGSLHNEIITEEPAAPVIPEKLVVPDTMSCGGCQLTFSDRDDQKSHYKSDWHRYNIHRKLLGQQPISEEKFEEIAGDVSSISGSEDDEDKREVLGDIGEETVTQDSDLILSDRKLHKVYFTNSKKELISVYRCLLHHKKEAPEDHSQLVKAAIDLSSTKNKYAVLLISAGHFAGAVFHGKDVIEHKTFHRYTVRAKRGTAQSSRDQKSNAPNSAGARLRRYNEEALNKEVQDLMEVWKDHLKNCHLIFVRIPVNNRAIFYAGKNPVLRKDDSRIRIIPIATRRPTFSEAKRVYQMLLSIECYGEDANVGSLAPLSPPRFYSKETEQLEIREPRVRLPKKDKSGRKSSTSCTRSRSRSTGLEKQESEEEDSGTEVDVQLVESMETLDLTHLREFEATKKKHKRKKKGNNQKDTGKDNDSSELDEDKLRWRNKLFTCCKTGDVPSLLSTLTSIKSAQADQDQDNLLTNGTHEVSEQSVEKSGQTSQTVSCQDEKSLSQTLSECDSSKVSQCGDITTTDMPGDCDSETIKEEIVHSVEHSVLNTSEADKCGTPDKSEESAASSRLPPVVDLVSGLLNSPVGDSKTTFLHLASREGHAEVITVLLTHGADPAIKDLSGKLAYNLGQTEVRNSFRRFMANFPDRYDYVKAQVPSALTAEMENEKKMKLAEKRKQKRKAANERNKDKKAAEAVVRAENEEKQRFIKLSDREKRALAAERRILQQHDQDGKSKPVLSRCFLCGSDMTGKIPFEYSDYKFCSTKCLREHRAKPAS